MSGQNVKHLAMDRIYLRLERLQVPRSLWRGLIRRITGIGAWNKLRMEHVRAIDQQLAQFESAADVARWLDGDREERA